MLGLWQRGQRAFVDVRIFNPFAPSYRNQSWNSTFKNIEATKKWEYNRRIMYNEHGTFTPLIFSINGGLSRETSTFYSRVAELLAIKRNSIKAETITWLRRKISFNLIRSSVLCLRGTRNYKMTDQNQIFDSDIKISNLNSRLNQVVRMFQREIVIGKELKFNLFCYKKCNVLLFTLYNTFR